MPNRLQPVGRLVVAQRVLETDGGAQAAQRVVHAALARRHLAVEDRARDREDVRGLVVADDRIVLDRGGGPAKRLALARGLLVARERVERRARANRRMARETGR